jgi:hypothetical protein
MRRTRSDPIQFRLLLDDYAVLERLAAATGLSPKEYVILITLQAIAEERDRVTT